MSKRSPTPTPRRTSSARGATSSVGFWRRPCGCIWRTGCCSTATGRWCSRAERAVGRNEMSVTGVNHVNIIANDLDETCQFYEDLLGFKRGETPGTAMGFKGAWLLDDED